MNKFTVISFYTKGTDYGKEAMKLERSLMKLGIPYHIAAVPNLGSWQKNTHFKAIFIRNMMRELFNSDVVWTDADSIFRSYPKLFDELNCDFAAHFRNWRHGTNELLSGTLYFTNNAIARQLVNKWIVFNAKNPRVWEQRNLHRALIKMKDGLLFQQLPFEYCCIFDDKRRNMTQPVIEHFQKSREYKRRIGL